MSLPLAFNTNFKNIPNKFPYIEVPKKKIDQINKKYFQTKKIRIGISWRSESNKTHLKLQYIRKSMKLSDLYSVLKSKECEFVNLQYGNVNDEIKKTNADIGTVITQIKEIDLFNDIVGLAAIMKNLDLIVTVGNINVPLGEAIGQHVWAMIPYSPDWYWFNNEKKTPWHPNVKIFKQNIIGNWENVIKNLKNELSTFVKKI